ncbi:borealin [Myiozetetes cayanensis]|uniref:borealin n=1 Tax=Myiozetetes cayanensis TaxID=478635 RepID=UPI0021603D1D|nr:borealin [Myiozetetes cayanensis]
MAPARKKGGSSSRSRKLAAFLKDFDCEVNQRLERLRADGERLVKEVEKLYDMEILRLPLELRQMNWLEYFGKEGSGKALEEVAMADLEIAEIDKRTAEVINSQFEIVKKVEKSKRSVEAIEEEAEPPSLPLPKKSRVDSQCPSETESENVNPRTAKVKASTKKPPVSRRPRSARVKRMSKRSSKTSFITPATGRMGDFCTRGGTSMITPRFDSRVFKTPGLRTPALNERVYTISANGSPLADTGDAFLTLPLGGGESIRLTAKDLTKKNFLQLNPKARGLMKKLSVCLAQACSEAKKPVDGSQ